MIQFGSYPSGLDGVVCNDRGRGASSVTLGMPVRIGLIYVLALRLHIHIHHAFHGSPICSAGAAAAAAASWIGLPGPGAPVWIAAGVFAAKHQLDLASVLFTAWVGATA